MYKSTNPTEILDPNPTISANKYRLFQNFPNPFNPSTTIRYYIPLRQRVSLLIYNVSGQLGRILVNELRSKGEYAEVWKGRDEQGRVVSNGIYFYSLKVDRKIIDTKKWCLSNKIAIYNTTAQNRHRKDWIKINC
ncbi:MAG: T9SS type A sorting domain-containing protein [Aliifodinibius sp.]|nr:T9SS type A sorting domain-containing protein [Fodinibius sp.]NIV12017.1 T9SS type A sorting domain-containing protein [Fodinibius sp.]NIY25663.1 T9SS type A sorting domain-containing protein [Fodinibius sp.]